MPKTNETLKIIKELVKLGLIKPKKKKGKRRVYSKKQIAKAMAQRQAEMGGIKSSSTQMAGFGSSYPLNNTGNTLQTDALRIANEKAEISLKQEKNYLSEKNKKIEKANELVDKRREKMDKADDDLEEGKINIKEWSKVKEEYTKALREKDFAVHEGKPIIVQSGGDAADYLPVSNEKPNNIKPYNDYNNAALNMLKNIDHNLYDNDNISQLTDPDFGPVDMKQEGNNHFDEIEPEVHNLDVPEHKSIDSSDSGNYTPQIRKPNLPSNIYDSSLYVQPRNMIFSDPQYDTSISSSGIVDSDANYSSATHNPKSDSLVSSINTLKSLQHNSDSGYSFGSNTPQIRKPNLPDNIYESSMYIQPKDMFFSDPQYDTSDSSSGMVDSDPNKDIKNTPQTRLSLAKAISETKLSNPIVSAIGPPGRIPIPGIGKASRIPIPKKKSKGNI